MMMAREDEGFEVSRDLRNSEITKDIPILMVSAVNTHSHFTLKPDNIWLPVDAFLEKPVNQRQLLQEVSRVLTP
jgi:CheY-like chemotaxis protein